MEYNKFDIYTKHFLDSHKDWEVKIRCPICGTPIYVGKGKKRHALALYSEWFKQRTCLSCKKNDYFYVGETKIIKLIETPYIFVDDFVKGANYVYVFGTTPCKYIPFLIGD